MAATHYRLDLLDKAAVAHAVTTSEPLATVTQLVYTALLGSDVWDEEERRANTAMLQHVVEPLLQVAPDLKHIDLMQVEYASPLPTPSDRSTLTLVRVFGCGRAERRTRRRSLSTGQPKRPAPRAMPAKCPSRLSATLPSGRPASHGKSPEN